MLDVANQLGALSLALMDRIEDGARAVMGRGGETPAAVIVIGYGNGITNDALRRILGLSHSGAVRLVDRLVADALVERRPGRDGREIALHLTAEGAVVRRRLLDARLGAAETLVEALSAAEARTLGELVRKMLSRQDTSQEDRFAICRLCDASICTDCPLPTPVQDHVGRGMVEDAER